MSQVFFDFVEPDPLQQPCGQTSWVAFDFETTGLYAEQDTIIEIGAVKFTLSGEVDTFESLVNPGRHIPEAAARISGISDEMVASADLIAVVLPRFLEFLGDHPLVAHNIAFDSGFLLSELTKLGLQWNEKWYELDSCEWARKVLPGMPNYKLQTLISVLNLSAGKAHRALDDAKAAKDLFLHCFAQQGFSADTLVAELVNKAERKK